MIPTTYTKLPEHNEININSPYTIMETLPICDDYYLPNWKHTHALGRKNYRATAHAYLMRPDGGNEVFCPLDNTWYKFISKS